MQHNSNGFAADPFGYSSLALHKWGCWQLQTAFLQIL